MNFNFEGLQNAGVQNYNGGPVNIPGFQASRQNKKRRVMEATRLYADVLEGREHPIMIQQAMNPTSEVFVRHLAEHYPGLYTNALTDGSGRQMGLRETMSVTDYQALYVDVLDRMYYGYYNGYPIVNKGLVKIHALRDFRAVSRYLLDGAVTPLTAMDAAAPPPQRALTGPVPQGGGSPASASTAPIQYSPLLYQAMTSVNWRAFVNDDLGIFQDLSNRLALAGNRGISKFITGKFWDANGPHASLYTTGYGNKIITANGASSNNPVLGVQGLSDAFKILAGMRDSGGDPILITGRVKLVYPPALHVTANNLMNQMSVYLTNEGGGAGSAQPAQFLQVNNWLVQRIDLVEDPYIPNVVTNGSRGNTSWALVVDPATQARPCVEMGFLNGFETPQIFTKVPNTARMGGGVDQMMGDFYSMDQDMKIVTVFGAAQIDGRSTVASNGTTS